MSPVLIFSGIAAYFLMLLLVGYITGRKADSDGYFLGNKQSIWWLVALGMLSDSMSGVSFISVPGAVGVAQLHYFQIVMGYVLGYLVIAYVLLPLYYKHQLTSIYGYLEHRFNPVSQKTGAIVFVISRLLGSAGRLFLAAVILQKFLFEPWGISFPISVAVIIGLILLYTIKGGIKTLVFTDAIQSVFLIGGLVIALVSMLQSDLLSHLSFMQVIQSAGRTEIFETNVLSSSFFGKHLIGGMFICIAMTGLDQNMMQKNLSIRTLKEAQWNMLSTSAIVVLVNVVFLTLGLVMIAFLQQKGIIQNGVSSIASDLYFPTIALEYLGGVAGMAFVLGLAAATFSSADSVLTTLTTSTYFDVFRFQDKGLSDRQLKSRRIVLHITFAVLLLLSILGFNQFSEGPVIDIVLGLANYTYGPLIGLFALGVFTQREPSGSKVIIVSILAPLLSWGIGQYTYVLDLIGFETLNLTYQFGYELILINGILSFLGLFVGSKVSQGL